MEFVEREHQETRAPILQAAIVRAGLFTLAWIVLTGGSFAYWGFALLVIGAATATSLALMPAGAWRWSLPGLVRFLPYFAWQSILGGLDVSRRALHPRAPIQPGYVEYTFRLPPGPWRIFFLNALSLLPGTTSCRIDGDTIRVHALHEKMPIVQELRNLEVRVADLFGVAL